MPNPQSTSRVTRALPLVGGIALDGPAGSPAGVIQYVPKVIKVPVVAKTTGEKDTTIDLPTKGLVLDVGGRHHEGRHVRHQDDRRWFAVVGVRWRH